VIEITFLKIKVSLTQESKIQETCWTTLATRQQTLRTERLRMSAGSDDTVL